MRISRWQLSILRVFFPDRIRDPIENIVTASAIHTSHTKQHIDLSTSSFLLFAFFSRLFAITRERESIRFNIEAKILLSSMVVTL